MDSINEMDDIINNKKNIIKKDDMIEICKLEIENCIKQGYTNEYIEVLKANLNNIYDLDLDYIIDTFGREMRPNEIADFWAYKFYVQKDVSSKTILNILMIDERFDTYIERNNIRYIWNKRKAELSYIKHGLKFEDAVELLNSNAVERFKIDGNRIKTFAINYDNIFVTITIELEDGKVKRIISYRYSNESELRNAEETYVKYETLFPHEILEKCIQLPTWRNPYIFGKLSRPEYPDYIGPAKEPILTQYEDDECITTGLRGR